MTLSTATGPRARADTTVSVVTIAWLVLAIVYIALRLAAVWQLPVGGSEWVHLSGAWNAVVGVDDARFVPTLFQALSALLLDIDASEALPRLFAFIATATVPVALYLLRHRLGDVVALLALMLLALDAPALWLGVAASALAFDIAITLWLLVLLVLPARPLWSWPIAAFAVATAGPLPLTLALAAGILVILRGQRLPMVPVAATAGAVVLGIAFASVGFGYGWQGLVVPPFALFAASFDNDWTTASAGELAVLYSWPLIAAAIVCATLSAWRWRDEPDDNTSALPVGRLTLVWFAAGLAWFLIASGTQAEVPLVAATLPAAFVVAPWFQRAIDAALSVRWHAWFALGVVVFTMALAAVVVVDWARFDRVGEAGEVARLVILGLAAVVSLGALALYAPARGVVIAPVVLLGGIVLMSGVTQVGFGADVEPFPSPQSPFQARVLSQSALDVLEEQDGLLVVHESLREQVTWPFRETVSLTVASSVPEEAAVALLPAGQPPPDGMALLEGEWSLEHHVEQPTSGLLRYIRWFTDRKHTSVEPVAIDVYVRGAE